MKSRFKNNLIRLSSIDSTNEYAFSVGEKCAVIANYQTAGKGRMGRRFVAEPGKSLLLSVLELDVVNPEITAWVAVCVHKALEESGIINCQIKWPNDIQVNEKKLCGILVERKANNVAIGIGINLYQNDFKELNDIATSAKLCGININKENLLINILDKLDDMILDFPQKRREYIEYYRKHCNTIKHKINIIHGEKRTNGFCTDISENFELIVRLEDNSIQKLSSGEISIRKED